MTALELIEYTRSGTATKRRIDNSPPPDVRRNLERLHAERLRIEAMLGQKIVILSGYRSKALNHAVGGSEPPKSGWSFHIYGCAMDFDPPSGLTHDELQKMIAREPSVTYDKIIEEKAKSGAHWLHFQIALPGQEPRRLSLDIELEHQGGPITRVLVG